MTPRARFGSGSSGSSSNLGMGSVRGESSVCKTSHGKWLEKGQKKVNSFTFMQYWLLMPYKVFSEYLKEQK